MARLASEERRDQIAEAVLKIISRDGLDGLSMPSVASEIGVVQSAIYRHFESKEDMVIYSIGVLKNRVTGLIKKVRDESDDVFMPFRNLLAFSRTALPIATVFPKVAFGLSADPSYEMRRSTIRGFLNDVIAIFCGILDDGKKKGDVILVIDTESAAFTFWGILVTSIIRWHLTGGDYDVEKFQSDAFDIFLSSIATEKYLAETRGKF